MGSGTPDGAAQELARRALARAFFGDYCRYVMGRYPQARHLELLAGYLERVERYVASGGAEGIGRLMVFMPPRYWKSTTCSVLFPQWYLGRNPDGRVILASYAASLATGFSRQVRNGIGGTEYQALFGALGTVEAEAAVDLARDSRAAEEWNLAAPYRGGMTAAGVGGGITGKGANLLIVDDPVKDRVEAESEAIRDRVWDWWTSTAYTRLESKAAVVVVLTRWHGDDLAGRLLEQMAAGEAGAEPWTVLLLAERAEAYTAEERAAAPWLPESDPLGRAPGAPLWAEKHDAAEMAIIEEAVGPYNWASLYQQRPYLREGGMFRREWFVVVDEPPLEVVTRVRCWDKAATAGGGAFSSGVCMSRGADGLLYVEHVVRGQWSTYQREAMLLRTANLDREVRPGRTVTWHPQDPGSAGLDSARATNAKLAEGGHEVHFEPVMGSKEVRAGPWSSALEAGMVRLVRGGWNQAFIEEHVSFPRGVFKDQVDAASDAFRHCSDRLRLRGARVY